MGTREVLLRMVDLLIGALLFAGTAEVAVRLVHPDPRAQVVRAAATENWEVPLHLVDGQPLWRTVGSASRAACPNPEGQRLTLYGTSISYGVDLPAEVVVSTRLQQQLDARAPGAFCVRNLAQPAYALSNQLVELAHDVQAGDLVVFEVWNPGDFVMVASDAYNIGTLALGPSGLPEPIPLPAALQRALYEHSQAWAFLGLATARQGADEGDRLRRYLDRALADTDRAGARLAVWLPSELSMPLHAADRAESVQISTTLAWASEHGVPTLNLSAAWEGVDPTDLRADAIHLNARGHARLTDTFDCWLAALGWTPPRGACGG